MTYRRPSVPWWFKLYVIFVLLFVCTTIGVIGHFVHKYW